MTTFSFWPILIASVVAFAIGAIWYSPALFGKEWMSLAKISAADVAASSKKGMWKLYAIQLVTTIITFSILGFIITAVKGSTAADGVFLGFIAWLGFPVMGSVADMLWTKKPLKLVLITTMVTLISWIIGGAIIGAWR